MIDHLAKDERGRLQDKIDEGDYELADLVEMKVPISNPYYSSSPGYERYYGEFDQRGTYYSYVMRKVINDTVYLLCLPDTRTTNLKQTGNELLSASGEGSSTPAKQLVAKKQVSADYIAQENIFGITAACFQVCDTEPIIFSETLSSCYMDPPVKPPSGPAIII